MSHASERAPHFPFYYPDHCVEVALFDSTCEAAAADDGWLARSGLLAFAVQAALCMAACPTLRAASCGQLCSISLVLNGVSPIAELAPAARQSVVIFVALCRRQHMQHAGDISLRVYHMMFI